MSATAEVAPRATMRALLARTYGRPEIVEAPVPVPAENEVRVRVRACSLNPLDYYFVMGKPYMARLFAGLSRPREPRVGADFAGTVDAIGQGVTSCRPGDDVFGAARGAMAEFVCAKEKAIGSKPAPATFEDAAALPIAALTALQGLRDHGRLQAGQKVIVNGGSGGVGTYAVQIAKALGAHVTAVCSTRHVATCRSLGADRVIDYTREDFTRDDACYDLMFDVAGSRSWSDATRVLAPRARYVLAGGPRTNRWIGPLGQLVRVRLASLGAKRTLILFMARVDRGDLAKLAEMLETGTLRPVLDRRFEFAEAAEAYRLFGEGHVGGKIVVSLPG